MKFKTAVYIIKYICLVLFIFAMSYLRWMLMLIWVIILIYDIAKRHKFSIFQDALIMLAASLLTLTHYPYCKAADYLRFYVFKDIYDSKAKQIAQELRGKENEYWDVYSTDGLWFITAGNSIYYMKYNDSIVVLFPTNAAFICGYIYYTDQKGKEMVRGPVKYWPEYASDDMGYEFFRPLSDEWSYIQFY